MYENAECDVTFICDPNESFEKELPEYIHYIPVNMKRGISIGGLKSCIEMKKIFKENRFDMIQYSTPNASLYAAVAGTMAKIPVRLYCQWGLVYVGFEGIKRKIFKLEEKLVCHLSTWIEPDSMGNLEFCHAEKLYPINKGSVVNKGSASGVSLEKFNISKKQQYRREIRKKCGPEPFELQRLAAMGAGQKKPEQSSSAYSKSGHSVPTGFSAKSHPEPCCAAMLFS